jgi:putative glutamine amidotransferase
MRQRIFLSIAFLLIAQQNPSYSATTEKPLIGINTDISGEKPEQCEISSPYIDAIKEAGGIPVLLPPVQSDDLKTLLAHLDGIMLIGGDDYPPGTYGQDKDQTTKLMKEKRSTFDLLLAKTALSDKDMPVLGICAGCQILNIADGGSLNQDIPSMNLETKLQHASPHGWSAGFNKHSVELSKDGKLAKAFGKNEITVVSSHHQCIRNPGKDFTISAKAPDGINEAIEMKNKSFVLGVQWHPERDFETNRALFQEFIREASAFHARKTRLQPLSKRRFVHEQLDERLK